MPTILDSLRTAADQRPDAPALRAGGTTVDYGDLHRAAARIAARIRRAGVGDGDRVSIVLPNSPEFVASYYGALLAGGVVVPLNPTHNQQALQDRLRDCTPGLLLLAPDSPPAVREAAAVAEVATLEVGIDVFVGSRSEPDVVSVDLHVPDDSAVASLIYGLPDGDQPGGVELTHANLVQSATTAASEVLRLDGDDTMLSCFPLFHILGQTCGFNAAISAGVCLSIPLRFDAAEMLREVSQQQVTVLATFPVLLPLLLREAQRGRTDLSSLRTILCSGGDPLSSQMWRQLESTFGCEVLESYGPAETAALACATTPGDTHRPGSVGSAVGGVEVRVVDRQGHDAPAGEAGELLLRGTHTMARYWQRPDATNRVLRDGWLHTRHHGRVDEDGRLFLVDTSGGLGSLRRRRANREGLLRRVWRSLGPPRDTR